MGEDWSEIVARENSKILKSVTKISKATKKKAKKARNSSHKR